MQKMWGRQLSFWDNCENFFGKDHWWWLIPTHPCLKINYLERMYTKNQLRQIVRSGQEPEEEEYDVNKKFYLTELRKSNFEKKILGFILILAVLAW